MFGLKKIINSLVIVPMIAAINFATATSAEEIKAVESEHLMWRVDPQPGSIYSVYLLGSYHVGKDCLRGSGAPTHIVVDLGSPALTHAFWDAETVVFEIEQFKSSAELTQESQQLTTKLIPRQRIPSTPARSLKGILDERTYELLKEKTAAINFPLDDFASLKPWVFIHAYNSFKLEKSGYKSECGLDGMIEILARALQKNTEELEDSNYASNQYTDLFVNMDLAEIQEHISAIIKTGFTAELFDDYSQKINSLIDTVNSGDSKALSSYINNWCNEDAEQCESLLYTRNRNWMPKIEELLHQKQDSLVVVGAGHLVGEQNLIQLLKQKGYRVRRFYNSFRLTEE